MTETSPPPVRYLRVAETAKLLRPVLRATFPGVKFRVRSSSYAGGASIHIDWTDGPTTDAVDRAVDGFRGADFDGMADLKTHARSWLCPTHGPRIAERYGHSYESQNGPVHSRCCHRAELVHMGADYVMTSRDWSPAARAMLEDMTARRYGLPAYDGNARVGDRDGRGGEWLSHIFYRETRGVTVAADPATGDPVIVADPARRPAVPAVSR